MRKGLCPKCNSSNIYHGVQSPLRAGDGLVHAEASTGNRHANIMLDAYLCASCGYAEMYVDEESMSKLDILRQDMDWRKVI